MTKLRSFFGTSKGEVAGCAIARVIGGTAVAAAITASISVTSASACMNSAADHESFFATPSVGGKDVSEFRAMLAPLEQQKIAYDGLFRGYGDLIDRMVAQTFEPGMVTDGAQLAVYNSVIQAWAGGGYRAFDDEYRNVAAQNVELREAIERMAVSITVMMGCGGAGVVDA